MNFIIFPKNLSSALFGYDIFRKIVSKFQIIKDCKCKRIIHAQFEKSLKAVYLVGRSETVFVSSDQ